MTHTLTLAWTRNGETISKSVNLVVEGEQNLDVTVPASTSDVQVQANITVARLAHVFISTDQTITLETNSPSAPAQSFTITAEKPFLWYTGCGWPNPLTTDITALYLTRAAANAAAVKIRYGYDATP